MAVRGLMLLSSMWLLVGCGSAAFYDEVPADDADNSWRGSVRDVIHQPPERLIGSDAKVCAEDLAGLKAQVSQAIELTIAHHDWQSQRCLAEKAQTVGTLYHAATGTPFSDGEGSAMRWRGTCSAAEIARQARACAGSY